MSLRTRASPRRVTCLPCTLASRHLSTSAPIDQLGVRHDPGDVNNSPDHQSYRYPISPQPLSSPGGPSRVGLSHARKVTAVMIWMQRSHLGVVESVIGILLYFDSTWFALFGLQHYIPRASLVGASVYLWKTYVWCLGVPVNDIFTLERSVLFRQRILNAFGVIGSLHGVEINCLTESRAKIKSFFMTRLPQIIFCDTNNRVLVFY